MLAGLAPGCGYTSDYVPPRDGRARAIWRDDKAVIAGPAELPNCATREQPPDGYRHRVPQDAHGYYYAPTGSTSVHVGLVVVGRPPILLPHLPSSAVPGANLGGGGGVDGGEYLFVILAVGAIVAFPFVAMGLALGHPEPEEEVAVALDQVNAYNDELRERLARCAAWHREEGAE